MFKIQKIIQYSRRILSQNLNVWPSFQNFLSIKQSNAQHVSRIHTEVVSRFERVCSIRRKG